MSVSLPTSGVSLNALSAALLAMPSTPQTALSETTAPEAYSTNGH
jgi:hypothetical protein